MGKQFFEECEYCGDFVELGEDCDCKCYDCHDCGESHAPRKCETPHTGKTDCECAPCMEVN